jgi:hypothetical protein
MIVQQETCASQLVAPPNQLGPHAAKLDEVCQSLTPDARAGFPRWVFDADQWPVGHDRWPPQASASSPSSTDTLIASPSPKRPSRIAMAIGSARSFWSTRFKGRAP